MTSNETLVTIGVILKPSGIGGAVKILPTTDEPGRFSLLKRVYLTSPEGERLEANVEQVRVRQKEVVIRFNVCATRNDAEHFRRWEIQIPEDECLPLPEGRYYIFNLIGLQAVTVDGEFIGTVRDVQSIANNDLFVIETSAHKEILIPFVEEFVKIVDIEGGRLVIQPIEGLLE